MEDIIMDNMECIIKKLQNEWDRSGEVKAVIKLSVKELEELRKIIAQSINTKQQEVEDEELSFEKCIDLSHENFIFLRLARKIKFIDEQIKKGNIVEGYSLSLDEEEFAAYKDLSEEK